MSNGMISKKKKRKSPNLKKNEGKVSNFGGLGSYLFDIYVSVK